MYHTVNPLKTSPEYTRAGVYGKCVLKENQIVFNGLTLCSTKMTCEHLLGANLTTRKYVFVLPNVKNESREINSIYSIVQ